MNKKGFLIFGIILTLFVSFVPHSSFALDEQVLDIYAQNNILFYDPSECVGGGSSSNVSVCDTSLPSETIQMLESAGIKSPAYQAVRRARSGGQRPWHRWFQGKNSQPYIALRNDKRIGWSMRFCQWMACRRPR